MGIIGDAFKKLFGLLWEVIKWIGNLLYRLFKPVIDVFMKVVEVIFALIDALLYFLYSIGLVVTKLFILIFQTAKLLWSLVVGFGKTLASLTYIPHSPGNGFSSTIGKLFKIAEPMQLNSVAYILLFIIWLFTAVSAIKLVSSIRVGGD
ncbi:hypothetical protein [Bacillus cereus group sp. BfR-BA-01455]|uniref:hypothetical protein n=1 Tax=Bacillus cereus group sp. BfR-BA-01455 TaxID=2920357 RepID=UPI001F55EA1E|nr:hypothetical protein [Bacillus cereus group sp. BfR-BA-01455]